MASRIPLVLNGGQIERLQAADSLDNPNLLFGRNGAGTTMVVGEVIRVGFEDTPIGFRRAAATGLSVACTIGLVYPSSITTTSTGSILTNGKITLTTTQWDAVTGQSGGLTTGSVYYLSATSGLLTTTAPSTLGQYVVEVGLALNTTDLLINITMPIEL